MERSINISVVVPVYNGSTLITPLLDRLLPVLEEYREYEVLLVDDGSSDTTPAEIQAAADRYREVRALLLEKNAGQQEATRCGICRAKGRIVVTMDDDLQHPPEDIPKLLESVGNGADIVFGIPAEAKGSEKANRPAEAERSEKVRRCLRKCGSRLKDTLFRWAVGALRKKPLEIRGVGELRPTSFRAFTSSIAAEVCEDRRSVPYLSAHLLRYAEAVDHVEIRHTGSAVPSPLQREDRTLSRYPIAKLAGAFSRLILSLPWIPPWILRFFSRRNYTLAEEYPVQKRLLVIGGGDGQLRGIRYARERGITVGVTDINPEAPAAGDAVFFRTADTFDWEATAEAAREFAADGIMTYGTDQPVLTVARAAEKLGLPMTISRETALGVTNKRVMKKLFTEHDIPTCPYGIIKNGVPRSGELSETLTGLVPPYVLKPVDSQGQRGVVRVETAAEAAQRLPETLSFSREGSAVIEEYYRGGEVTLSGWVVDGRLCPLSITDRVTVAQPPHIGVCVSHNYPSRYFKSHGERVLSLSRRIVSAFAVEKGPVYFQFLIGEEGVRVNEIACRIGGAYEDEFIPMLTGVEVLDMAFDEALYGALRQESRRMLENFRYPAEGCASVLLFFTKPLTVASVGSMEEVLQLPGVRSGRYLLKPGRRIGPMENSTGRAGYVIITGENAAEVNGTIHKVYNRLGVYDEKGRNRLADYKEKSLHIVDAGNTGNPCTALSPP
ncbi:MAG: glycosyltransferase [Spirochaetaceae bacterium]